jgi:hypothetical protein
LFTLFDMVETLLWLFFNKISMNSKK